MLFLNKFRILQSISIICQLIALISVPSSVNTILFVNFQYRIGTSVKKQKVSSLPTIHDVDMLPIFWFPPRLCTILSNQYHQTVPWCSVNKSTCLFTSFFPYLIMPTLYLLEAHHVADKWPLRSLVLKSGHVMPLLQMLFSSSVQA